MSKKLRIHQFLTRTGLFKFKRDVYDALHQGLVSIDGKIVKDKDYQFKPSLPVKYNGRIVNISGK